MKKKIVAILAIMLLLFSTGCTKYVKQEDNSVVTYEKTGQNITQNILCRPTDEELVTLYSEHENSTTVPMDELPECTKFKPNSLEYVSLWESIFVKPLAWLIIQVGKFVKNYGVSVMIIGLLIRLILLPLSIKSAKQSESMKKIQPEMARLEKKYENKTDSQSQMAKSQEMMLIYKKYKISPISGCIMAFIQLPLFFAFLEAVNRVPAIFEGSFLSLNLGMTPWVGIASGNYWYILLLLLIVASTYFSFKKSMASAGGMGEAQKQMGFMTNFMVIAMAIASLRLPTAIALYWIVTNGFAVIQNLIVKRSMK